MKRINVKIDQTFFESMKAVVSCESPQKLIDHIIESYVTKWALPPGVENISDVVKEQLNLGISPAEIIERVKTPFSADDLEGVFSPVADDRESEQSYGHEALHLATIGCMTEELQELRSSLKRLLILEAENEELRAALAMVEEKPIIGLDSVITYSFQHGSFHFYDAAIIRAENVLELEALISAVRGDNRLTANQRQGLEMRAKQRIELCTK